MLDFDVKFGLIFVFKFLPSGILQKEFTKVITVSTG